MRLWGTMQAERTRATQVMAMLCLALAIAAFWVMTGLESQRQWPLRDAVELSLGERYFRVPVSGVDALGAESELWFREQSRLGKALVRDRLNSRLDGLFLRVRQRIPDFLDWYYSVRGDYSRLGMSALSTLGFIDDDYVRKKAAAVLFEQAGWEASLVDLERGLMEELRQHERRSRRGWMQRMRQRLEPYEVPPPIDAAGGSTRAVSKRLSLDELNRMLEVDSLISLDTRMALGSGGGAVAGIALWRGAIRGAAGLTGRRAAARGAGRAALRVGSAAAGGALVCSPGGPAALGCALVAGTAVWLSVDWALIRLDEALTRERMEQRLQAGLSGFRQRLERELRREAKARFEALQEARSVRIRAGFRPLESIGDSAAGA